MAAAECIDAVEIRTCNAKILTSFKVNAKKASMQSKYIVIGNSISLDGSSETSAESAQSITSVLQIDQTFPRQDSGQTQPALAQKSKLGRKRYSTLESQRRIKTATLTELKSKQTVSFTHTHTHTHKRFVIHT